MPHEEEESSSGTSGATGTSGSSSNVSSSIAGGGVNPIPLIKGSKEGTVSTGLGAFQAIQSIQASKDAKGLEPSLIDPAQATALADLKRRRRAFETGTAISAFVTPIKQLLANSITGALRSGAGLRGISKVQRVAGRQLNELLARGQQQADSLRTQEIGLQNLISRRKLDLTRVRQAKQEAKAAEKEQSGTSNLLSGARLS